MASLTSQNSIVIQNLLETTNDKNEKVRTIIYLSLRKIALCHPSEVISAAINYRRRNPKLSNNNVCNIFDLIKNVCEERLCNVENPLIEEIINCAIEESLKASVSPFISADLLPVIGTKYCDQVFSQLQKYMIEGVAPHASVIYILGHLSVANMVLFHPFSTNVFKYLLSILHVTKSDNMRKLYANTVIQLVESTIEQISADELSAKKQQYSPIIEEIFDLLVTNWLLMKDVNVCEVITQAVGALVLLFSNQKLTNDTSHILNSFLSLYKKPSTFPKYVITQGLSNFLSVVPRAALQPLLDTLLTTLHVMVAVVPDFNIPVTVKNHNEVLRCYNYIGVLFEDKLPDVLLTNLKSTSDQDKLVGLIVTTHLLNSSESVLKPGLSEILSALHKLLNDTNMKINKCMAKIINVIAYRDYLSEKDAAFIEFLARHSYHNTMSNAEQDDLESMCRNTLLFLITTLSSVQSLCWKVLIQLLMNGEHLQSVSVSAKCLAYLITNCELSILEKNCYDRSEVIFVRVISLLGSPLHDNRGVYLVRFLNEYIKWKVKVDPLTWKLKLKDLMLYLEDSVWDEVVWEEKLLTSLSASFIDDTKPWLEAVNAETVKLLGEFLNNTDQNLTNSNNVAMDERAILYKLLALLSQYIDGASIVNANITKILAPINQRSLVDLKACSRSVGILSRSHFNQVFNELDKYQRTELMKKPSKLFGLIKDTKGETEIEIIRRMVCECFSSMLVEAPSRLLLPKLKQLQQWFLNLIYSSKDTQTVNSCSEALLHISEVLLKSEDSYEHVEECRKELLTFISTSVHNEKSMPGVMTLKTISTLFKLKSSNSATEKLHLLQKCLNKMFQFYSASNSTTTITETGAIETDLIIQQLCLLIENSIDTKKNTVLEEIVVFLRPWLSHKLINHRIISLYLLKSALNRYIMCYFHDTKNYLKFTSVDSLLGRLYVRTFEENRQMSRLACECITLLFAIVEANADSVSRSVENIQKSIENTEQLSIEFFRISVYCKLSPEQLHTFSYELIDGLLDTESACASGTASLLNVLFTELGTQFHRQALDIFTDLLQKLMRLDNEYVQKLTINAILSLARHHKEMFVNTMFNQAIPFHKNICLCWAMIPEQESFTDDILKRLFETIKWNTSHETNAENKQQKNVTLRPLVAIAAVKEILSASPTSKDFSTSHFIDLLPAILMLIPVYMGKGMNSINGVNKFNKDIIPTFVPAKLIFQTLISVMKHANCENIEEEFAVYLENIEFRRAERKPIYYEMIRNLAKNVSRFSSEIVTKILESLEYYISKEKTEGQRVTAVIFFVEIFNLKSCEDAILVDTILFNLLNFLNDECAFVRENSLKGLANISNLEFILVERYKERLLSALTAGLEDIEGNTQVGIIVQSLIGISKLLPFLSSGQYASIFITISIRIKPFFEKENLEVRRLSLRLFGELANFPSTELSSFREQVVRNLPCVLFHCGESEPEIVAACKFSLKAICPSLKSELLSAEISQHLSDESKFDYQDFLVSLAELLSKEIPEMSSNYITIAISYSKSSWPEIRASAVLFIGMMYANQAEINDRLPVDVLTSRILALLKDIDANVRANAATSLGLLLYSASVDVLSKK